ncbi:MAG: hypothetical protein V7K98_12350 [Nostoc sp.]
MFQFYVEVEHRSIPQALPRDNYSEITYVSIKNVPVLPCWEAKQEVQINS